jgi:hypothetical protein
VFNQTPLPNLDSQRKEKSKNAVADIGKCDGCARGGLVILSFCYFELLFMLRTRYVLLDGSQGAAMDRYQDMVITVEG